MTSIPAFVSAFSPRLSNPSSWTSSTSTSSTPVTRRRPNQPHMKLISHEKLSVIVASDDGEMANYKLSISIPGDYSKKKRAASVKSMRESMTWPGFRKGTIPPFLWKEVNEFALRDSAEEMIDEAIQQLDLSRSEGDDSVAKYELKDGKTGEDFTFDCEIILSAVTDKEIDVNQLEDIIALPDGMEKPKEIEFKTLQNQTQTIDTTATTVPQE